jgi:hypothetical protein
MLGLLCSWNAQRLFVNGPLLRVNSIRDFCLFLLEPIYSTPISTNPNSVIDLRVRTYNPRRPLMCPELLWCNGVVLCQLVSGNGYKLALDLCF